MKKIPKSITVTVRNGGNFRATRPGKTYNGRNVKYRNTERVFHHPLVNVSQSVKDYFPETPAPPYSLTYAVSKDGNYSVTNEYSHVAVRRKGARTIFPVCFLPPEWHGLRVSRAVKRIIP